MTTRRELQTWKAIPDRLIMYAPGLSADQARVVAEDATDIAQRYAPKLSGASSARMLAIHGEGWFGVQWMDDFVWYQEAGIKAFTMRKLAGKTIPMWIDDPTGIERRKNPKAEIRTTRSGKVQVLIFRKVAKMNARRTVVRHGTAVSVPASYPGAPGRIAVREAMRPWTAPGRVGGRIAMRNVGVRWRHPGLHPRSFIYRGLAQAAYSNGVPLGEIVAVRGVG